MARDFLIGCQAHGITHGVSESVDRQFRMIRDSGVFDYLDRLPPPELMDEYIRCSQKYGMPMHTGTAHYVLGRDDAAFGVNMANAARLQSTYQNIVIRTYHADGHALSDDEVVDCYLRVWEMGARLGVQPSFELHVATWSEDFRRVVPVAEKVRARGIRFNFTLDYSHCAFKIDNPEEQELSKIREDVDAGLVVLDPFEPGNLCERWLAMNMIVYAQFRPVSPNGPKNVWSTDAAGKPGRGIQYPFLKPKPGEWHSPWQAWRLEPAKEALRKVMRYHLSHPESPLRFINTEMIDRPDYGDNAKYSLFEHNVACARWIRSTWNHLKAVHDAGLSLEISY